MSQTIGTNTSNQLTVNTDTSKIFIWNNRYDSTVYINNSTYDPITLVAGTVMGRIATTQVVVPCEKGASNGSQYPIGILAHDLVVEGGDTVAATLCVAGDVAEEKVVFFNSAATGMGLDTVVSDRSMRDRIAADTVGINLVASTEMTAYDND